MSPLPFAPPPKDSSLYQQLESTTLQTLTPDQLDTIRAKTFSQGTEGNEDEYRRLLLLGLASNALSISGPMPMTGQTINVTADTAGTTVTLFRPPEGEVWSVIAASYIVNTISGSLNHLLSITGEYSGAPTGSVVVSEKSSSDAGDNFGDVDFSPLHLDNNLELGYTFYGTATSVSVRLAAIRVR